MNCPLLLGSLVLATLGVTTTAEPLRAESTAPPAVRSVSADLEQLEGWFNENRGTPRLVVLLSPT